MALLTYVAFAVAVVKNPWLQIHLWIFPTIAFHIASALGRVTVILAVLREGCSAPFFIVITGILNVLDFPMPPTDPPWPKVFEVWEGGVKLKIPF